MADSNPRWRSPRLEWRGGNVEIPAHTHEVLVAWIERGENPFDDFFDSLLTNDLRGAVNGADDENLLAIPHIVGWLYNFAPSACYGTEDKVTAWQEQGGLGIEAGA